MHKLGVNLLDGYVSEECRKTAQAVFDTLVPLFGDLFDQEMYDFNKNGYKPRDEQDEKLIKACPIYKVKEDWRYLQTTIYQAVLSPDSLWTTNVSISLATRPLFFVYSSLEKRYISIVLKTGSVIKELYKPEDLELMTEFDKTYYQWVGEKDNTKAQELRQKVDKLEKDLEKIESKRVELRLNPHQEAYLNPLNSVVIHFKRPPFKQPERYYSFAEYHPTKEEIKTRNISNVSNSMQHVNWYDLDSEKQSTVMKRLETLTNQLKTLSLPLVSSPTH